MDISISCAKEIREILGATHLVVFAIDSDGKEHVATHGATESDAREAAIAGNKLKKALGWPDDLCRATPLKRCCDNCTFWKADYGMHCFNGWSGDGSTGWCRLNPTHVKVSRDNKCQFFQPK